MRCRPDWMNVGHDLILETLKATEMVLSPSVIAKNKAMDRSNVNKRLSELERHGLVERPERGYYRISPLGVRYLRGDLDAGDVARSGTD